MMAKRHRAAREKTENTAHQYRTPPNKKALAKVASA
jgi:hypothetical protein